MYHRFVQYGNPKQDGVSHERMTLGKKDALEALKSSD